MLSKKRTGKHSPFIPTGASSLLEVLFVLIVAMAFGIGLYREFSSVEIEKNVTQFNAQLESVTNIANLFYFAVDPSTLPNTSTNVSVRFCNQTPNSSNEDFQFNTPYSLQDVANLLCYNNNIPSGVTNTPACQKLSKLIQTITSQAQAANAAYWVMLAQNGPTANKYIAILLESTASSAQKSQTILNPDLFNLFKGKIAGNPRFVPSGEKPFDFMTQSLKGNGIVWTIPPSQGTLSLFSAERLSNANMQATNELINQWDKDTTSYIVSWTPGKSGYDILGCETVYTPPPAPLS